MHPEHPDRCLSELDKGGEVEAEKERRDEKEEEECQLHGREPDGFSRRLGLPEEHIAEDAHVVIERHHAIEHTDDREPEPFCINEGGEDIQFADESRGRRHAGKRQEEDRHSDADEGGAVAKPLIGIDILAAGPIGDDHNDIEGAEVHEEVDDKVDEDGGDTFVAEDDDAEEHIACVGDTRVGEEAFQVALREREQAIVRLSCAQEARTSARQREEGQGDKKTGREYDAVAVKEVLANRYSAVVGRR